MRWNLGSLVWWTAAALWLAVFGLAAAVSETRGHLEARESAEASTVADNAQKIFFLLHPSIREVNICASSGDNRLRDGSVQQCWLIECSDEGGNPLGTMCVASDTGRLIWVASDSIVGEKPFGTKRPNPTIIASWYARQLWLMDTGSARPHTERLWWGGTAVTWCGKNGSVYVAVDPKGTLIRATQLTR